MKMWTWLVKDWQWPSAAVFASLFLLAITPIFLDLAGLAITLVFIQLPIYLIHQGEEHIGDRFRLHINQTIGGGREVLTSLATFIINALGVWVFDLVALYCAWLVAPSSGLAAGYLSLVNGVVHVLPAIRQRAYNPGLVTAILLLIPFGIWCVVRTGSEAGWTSHAVGLGAAIAIHAAIIGFVVVRMARLSRPAGQKTP
ncbi:MAG: HXXEE domain-containing protein [Gemmataceae bacterium]